MYITWIAFKIMAFSMQSKGSLKTVAFAFWGEAVRCGVWLQPTHLAIIALKGEHSVGYAQLSMGPRGQNVHTNAQWSV